MHFNACWFASTSGFGVVLSPDGGAHVTGVTFTGCHFVNNSSHALVLNNSNVSNVLVDGCLFANGQSVTNVAGVYVQNNVGHFSINNCRFGQMSPFQSFGLGVFLTPGNNNFVISNNDFSGSTQAAISLPSSLGNNGVIANNIGYGPYSVQAAVGTSPWSYKAGPSAETHYLSGGSVSQLQVQNLALPYNSQLTTIHLGPNESYTVQFDSTPTVKYVIH